jgi:hypothetical protein
VLIARARDAADFPISNAFGGLTIEEARLIYRARLDQAR